ncbi:hypothetical protein C7212DRAFT_346574 [Tuber magnatum]|uniref:GPI inositol-deacylase winged helix domain-containing protein n=1 Tax=Tuber magnatum TaxID=42249 RepID=A0A317SJV0_9PEZI|nr:hypothetical protein C7212DRAFT_346574 [Tuber magnatum]
MDHTDKQQSSARSDCLPLPQRGYSSGIGAGSSIQGNYSGNWGSGNTYGDVNTTNYNYMAPGPLEREAKILQCLYTSKYEEHRDRIFKGRAHLTKFAEEEFKAKGERFTGEVYALWDILVKCVAGGECGNVICVVDALDECEERTRDQFIRGATSLRGPSTPDIPLNGEEEVESIATDVTRVIKDGIERLESHWEQQGRMEYLRDLLESSADGTFLWVSLVLKILRRFYDNDREELTKVVTTAPPNLEELYTKILDKSKSSDKTRSILSIVVTAARPFTLREMYAALKIKREHRSSKELGDMSTEFKNIVKNLCGLFVRVIDSKIYLVHQTARKFLIKGSESGRGSWQYTLSPVDYNFLLADICISYLSLEDFENDPLVENPNDYSRKDEFGDYVEKYALLDYAASHWADHFRVSQTRQMEPLGFTRPVCEPGSKRFLTWWKVYWRNNSYYSRFPTDFMHLMIASWLEHSTVVERLLEEGGELNARSPGYGTALSIAAYRKDEDIIRFLLRRNGKACLFGREYNITELQSEVGDTNSSDSGAVANYGRNGCYSGYGNGWSEVKAKFHDPLGSLRHLYATES